MATCRVLLADEDDGVRAQLAGYLAQAGMDVVEARDGEAAWRIFSDDSVDAVVVDVGLPKVTGRDLVARVRAHATRGKTAVVVTGLPWNGPEDVDTARALKADAVFKRPLAIKEMMARLDALIMLRTGKVRTGAVQSSPPPRPASSPPARAPLAFAGTPPLTGEASLPALAAVAVHAFEQRLSGALDITDPNGTRTLYLADGLVVDVRSTRVTESLAAQMVEDGVLTEAAAHTVGVGVEASGVRFGEAVMRQLGVPAGVVVASLERQHVRVAVRALGSVMGGFALNPWPGNVVLQTNTRLDPLSLVMRACLDVADEQVARALLTPVADWPVYASDVLAERQVLLQRLRPGSPVAQACASASSVRAALEVSAGTGSHGVRELLALLLTQSLKVAHGHGGMGMTKRAAVLAPSVGRWGEPAGPSDALVRDMVAAEWLRTGGRPSSVVLGLREERPAQADVEHAVRDLRLRFGPPALDAAALGPARPYLELVRARRDEAARVLGVAPPTR